MAKTLALLHCCIVAPLHYRTIALLNCCSVGLLNLDMLQMTVELLQHFWVRIQSQLSKSSKKVNKKDWVGPPKIFKCWSSGGRSAIWNLLSVNKQQFPTLILETARKYFGCGLAVDRQSANQV